jgi:hypothetical protein
MVIYNGKPVLEGVDKIKVILQPFLRDFIINKHFESKNKLTLHTAGYYSKKYQRWCNNYYYLAIHAEFIDPELDISITVAKAIYELIKNNALHISNDSEQKINDEIHRYKSTLHIEENEQKKHKAILDYININEVNYNKHISFEFIQENLDLFVYRIKELEIFFDFKPESVSINEEALKQELARTDRKPSIKMYNDTIYSNDFRKKPKRTSILAYYNRAEHLKKQGQIKYKLIDAYPYKERIEFRLNLNNYYGNRYLPYSCYCLGNINQIITGFSDILVQIYKKYFYGIINIHSTEQPRFTQIYEAVKTAKIRYRGNNLSKVQRIQKKLMENGHVIPAWQISRRKFQTFLLTLENYLERHEAEWDKTKKYDRIENMLQEYDEYRNVDANRYSTLTIIQDELDDYDDVVEIIEHEKEYRMNNQNTNLCK